MRRVGAAIGAAMAAVLSLGAVTVAGATGAQDVVVSANPEDGAPNVLNGRIMDFAQIGNRIYVAGNFTSVENADGSGAMSQAYLFAFDATTLRLDPGFRPNLNGQVSGLAAAPDGSGVYASGKFKTVDGVAQRGITKLHPATGARIAAFAAKANGEVTDVVARGTIVYLGGGFTKVNTTSRIKLAAVDGTTGAVLDRLNIPVTEERYTDRVGASVFRIEGTPDGSKLVVIGNFRKVGGESREQVAVIDTSTNPATLSPWQTDGYAPNCASIFDSYVKGLDVSPDGTYMVIATTGAFGGLARLCDTAARWELTDESPGQQPTWVEYTGGDTALSAAITGTAVYVGGHQRWYNNGHTTREEAGPGAVRRSGVVALDPTTGVPLSWNPGRRPGRGMEAIFANDRYLFMGSDTTQFGGEQGKRLAVLPVATGTPNPAPAATPLPVQVAIGRPDGSASGFGFDGVTLTPASAPTWANSTWGALRGAWVNNGLVTWLGTDNVLRSRDWSASSLGAANTNLTNRASYLVEGPRNSDGAGFAGSFWHEVGDAIAYVQGRMYYTRTNDTKLFWRSVSTESGIVGSVEYVADATRDWSGTTGLEFAGAWLYASESNGQLARYYKDGNKIDAASRAVVDTGASGANWANVTDFVFVPTAGTGIEPPPPGGGGGPVVCADGQFRAEYFNDRFLTGNPVTVRCEDAIAYDWGGAAPSGTNVNPDNFSVRWTGNLDLAGGLTSFTINADNGMRVLVDGALVLDRWNSSSSTNVVSTVNLTGGVHQVVVEYNEQTGNARAFVAISNSELPPAPGITCPAGQFVASYWANRTLSGPAVLERCEPGPGFASAWGFGSPDASVPVDDFSARWLSNLVIDETRSVTFTTRTDDGVRLYVDGAKVLESWVDRFSPSTFTTTLTLGPGTHQVEMHYYVRTGSATAEYAYALGPVVPPSQDVGVVVSDAVALRGGERAVIDHLVAQGHNVTVFDDSTITAAQADGLDVVYVTGTVVASEIGSRLNPATVAIVSGDVQVFARTRMTPGGSGNQGTVAGTGVTIVDSGHPLAAGLSGTVTLLTASGSLGYGRVNTDPGGATVVAEVAPGQASVFAYAAGATLADGSAAAGCRIGVPYEASTAEDLTLEGTAILDAAISYAASC